MGMVDGTGLIEWNGGLFDPAGDLLPRVRWVFDQMDKAGFRIILNEAGRPYGVESDRYVRNSWQTASGRSTVWFQWGRYERDETPSAANPYNGPYASNHTKGLSVDTNTLNMGLRRQLFAQVGMDFDVSSESWHCTIYRPSSVDLSAFATLNVTPIAPEEKRILTMVIFRNYESKKIWRVFGTQWIEIPGEIDVKLAIDTWFAATGQKELIQITNAQERLLRLS